MATEGEESWRKLEVVAADNDDEKCRTFVIHGEDHTLGNSLRYTIMKNPEVIFCGYSIPHPSENKINFRIQTKELPALDVLKKGLKDLSQLCDHVLTTFEKNVELYKRQVQEDDMEMDSVT